eukprot:78660-Rhodomonas_salina.2
MCIRDRSCSTASLRSIAYPARSRAGHVQVTCHTPNALLKATADPGKSHCGKVASKVTKSVMTVAYSVPCETAAKASLRKSTSCTGSAAKTSDFTGGTTKSHTLAVTCVLRSESGGRNSDLWRVRRRDRRRRSFSVALSSLDCAVTGQDNVVTRQAGRIAGRNNAESGPKNVVHAHATDGVREVGHGRGQLAWSQLRIRWSRVGRWTV